jgi:molybdate transport system regulatory protein
LVQFANLTEGLRFRIVLKPGIAIGPGKADLLEAIAETASLTAAARRFGMSYKRSWSLVQELKLGHFVLNRYRRMEADAGKAISAGVRDLRKHLAKPKTRRSPSKKAG